MKGTLQMENFNVPMRVFYPTPCAQKATNYVEKFEDGNEYRWTQYLPTGLNDGLPLVVEIHGGGGTGERQCESTAWAELAERENFVVIYPSANVIVRKPDMKSWRCQRDDFYEDADYIYEIIMHVCKKYNIDRQRIYMSGMSFGDMMSTIFAAKYAGILAGLCSFGGPTAPYEWDKLTLTDELPVLQIRGELDVTIPSPEKCELSENEVLTKKSEFYVWNREKWMEKLGTSKIPDIVLKEKINYALYKGKTSDLRYVECKNMGHVEPQFGMNYAWKHCFSRYRRTEKGIERIVESNDINSSEGSFAIAAGFDKAYTKNEVIRLEVQPVMGIAEPIPETSPWVICQNDYARKSVIYIQLNMLAKLINGNINKNKIEFKNKSYQFYRDNCLVASPKVHFSMDKPALLRDEILWVPASDALSIMGFKCAETDGVLYCSKDNCYLTRGFATLIRRIFEVE